MKHILRSLALCALAFANQPAHAHKEWVHQHMVQQAYLFLEAQIGPIATLRDAVGVFGTAPNGNYRAPGNENMPFLSPYPIAAGAWREDSEDIVYGYGGLNGITPSITHFWEADEGDGHRSVPVITLLGPPPSHYAPNAWEKAQVFLFGGHEIIILAKEVAGQTTQTTYYITYTSLTEFYKGHYYLSGTSADGGCTRTHFAPQYRFDPYFTQSKALHILGRVAHLLGDMGVPAHAHSDLHPCPINQPDFYENQMGDVYYNNNSSSVCERDPGSHLPAYSWTATTAAQQGGILQDMYCEPTDREKMRYLFYTSNQLADFFPSGVNPNDGYGGFQNREPGNAALPMGTNNYLSARYAALGNPPSSIDISDVGNENFNFNIRAVATLFQWFAYNSGIINDYNNTQLPTSTNDYRMCANESLDIPSPFRYTTPITWAVSPSVLATGVEVISPFTKRRYYTVTAQPNVGGLATVSATYAGSGCYAGTYTLKRDIWVGTPSVSIKVLNGVTDDIVCPGFPFQIQLDQASGLMGNLTYQWTSTNATLGLDVTSATVYVEAPSGQDQPFQVRCTVTNECGSTPIYRGFHTAGQYFPKDCNVQDFTSGGASPSAKKQSLTLDIYPNPSMNEFDIQITGERGEQEKDRNYTLLNGMGRVVRQGILHNGRGHVVSHDLPLGVYSLQVQGAAKKYKVLVIH